GAAADSLLGYGWVMPYDDHRANARVYQVTLRAHPATRPLGLERAIALSLLEIVDSLESTATDQRPQIRLKANVFQQQASLKALWEGFALRPARTQLTMARSLADPIDEPEHVEGVTIRNYRRPQDDEAALSTI